MRLIEGLHRMSGRVNSQPQPTRKTPPRHGQTMFDIAKIIAFFARLQYGRSASQKYGRSAYNMALSRSTCRLSPELNVCCTSIRGTVVCRIRLNDTSGAASRCLCSFEYQGEDVGTACKGITGQIGDQLMGSLLTTCAHASNNLIGRLL